MWGSKGTLLSLLDRYPDTYEVEKGSNQERPQDLQYAKVIAVQDQGGVPFIRSGGCTKGCGACCTAIILPLDPDILNSPKFDDYMHWAELHGVRFIKQKNPLRLDSYGNEMDKLSAWIPIRCSELQEDKSCGLIGTPERPDMCGTFPLLPSTLGGLEEICTYTFTKVETKGAVWDEKQRILGEQAEKEKFKYEC